MIRPVLAAFLSLTMLSAQESPGGPVASKAAPARAPGVFVVNNEAVPSSLDPAYMTRARDHRLYLALFEGLVVPGKPEGSVEPGLAESWTIGEDQRTYTFRLREAVWSDGTPIVAQDVVDSWLRELAPGTQAKQAGRLTSVIEGASAFHAGKGPRENVQIRALDPRTFQVVLKKWNPFALSMMTESCFAVVPGRVLDRFGNEWTKPAHFVGNGPFVLKEWNDDGRIIVEKNPKYWDSAHVRLDRIVFEPIPDPEFAVEAYRAGKLDWSPVIDDNSFPEIRSRPDFQNNQGAVVALYIFNQNRKPFADARVRRALSLAVDRRVLCDRIANTGEFAMGGMIPPLAGYAAGTRSSFDPDKARQLMAEAGYPGGKGFPKFKVLYNTMAYHEQITDWMLAQWKSVLGIEGKGENVNWQVYQNRHLDRDFDICRLAWRADTADPITFLNLFRTGSSDNRSRHSNPALDALLEAADKLPHGAERNRLLEQAESLAIDQDQAAIPLFNFPVQDLINLDRWEGWSPNAMGIHPWKEIRPKSVAAKTEGPAGGDPSESSGRDTYLRPLDHYYQLDPKIGTGATGLCGPTSSAMAINYLATAFPKLKPAGMSCYDLIRRFASGEGAGKTTGVTGFAIETELESFIENSGYRPDITALGISWHGPIITNRRYSLEEVKQALKADNTAVMVIIGGYDYDQRDNNYIRDYGHVMVLVGYDSEGLILADPAKMSERSHYRLVPVVHQDASLMNSSKAVAMVRRCQGYFELVRDRLYHDIIETILLVRVANP